MHIDYLENIANKRLNVGNESKILDKQEELTKSVIQVDLFLMWY